MSLVRKSFSINADTTFECYIFIVRKPDGSEEFWFKARDLAEFLEYTKPTNAITNNVPCEWRRTWSDLKGFISNAESSENDDDVIVVPSNWQPHTVFVSEPGLYALVTRSKKPEAVRFTRWFMEDVLPALRRRLLFEYAALYRDADELARIKYNASFGYVYLATTPAYRNRDVYKIGFTSNPHDRLKNLNVVRVRDDEFFYVKLWPTADCRAAERWIFRELADRRLQKEFFRFDNASSAVDRIDMAMQKL